MIAEVKACRSRGTEGQPCQLARGHKPHFNPVHMGMGAQWTGGIRTAAFSYTPDNGYMSEADYQTWGRL